MPRFTYDHIKRIAKRRGATPESIIAQASDKGLRRNNVIQKQQADSSRREGEACDADNQPTEEAKANGIHRKFRVTITFRTSDRRIRDGYGMSETIADAIIAAIRGVAAIR
jgi:hypothetical protein